MSQPAASGFTVSQGTFRLAERLSCLSQKRSSAQDSPHLLSTVPASVPGASPRRPEDLTLSGRLVPVRGVVVRPASPHWCQRSGCFPAEPYPLHECEKYNAIDCLSCRGTQRRIVIASRSEHRCKYC